MESLAMQGGTLQFSRMIRVKKGDLLAVQNMIEHYRLQGFLEIVAVVCGQMAETAREQCHDPVLAEMWDRDAMAIDKVREYVSN